MRQSFISLNFRVNCGKIVHDINGKPCLDIRDTTFGIIGGHISHSSNFKIWKLGKLASFFTANVGRPGE